MRQKPRAIMYPGKAAASCCQLLWLSVCSGGARFLLCHTCMPSRVELMVVDLRVHRSSGKESWWHYTVSCAGNPPYPTQYPARVLAEGSLLPIPTFDACCSI